MTAPNPRPGDTVAPTVWLLVASANTQHINPDLLLPYGRVRSILPAKHVASWEPEGTLATLYEALREFQPGDYICWMGGDTLVCILAGIALERLGVDRVRWLRHLGPPAWMVRAQMPRTGDGREEYQVINIQLADMALPHTRDDNT